MAINSFRSLEKSENKNVTWVGGIIAGTLLYKIPIVGVAVGAFSLFMLFYSLSSDQSKAMRLFTKGMVHYEQGHYSYSYILFKKAYEVDSENPEIIRMLVLSNIQLGKDPVESRILIDELDCKWRSKYSKADIDELRDMWSLKLVS